MRKKLKTEHLKKSKLISRKEAIKMCKDYGLDEYYDDAIPITLFMLTGEIVDKSNQNIVDIDEEVLEATINKNIDDHIEKERMQAEGRWIKVREDKMKENHKKRSFLIRFFFDEYYDIRSFTVTVVLSMIIAFIIYLRFLYE